MKKILIGLAVLVLALAGGSTFTFVNFQNSPQYTIYQLAIAAKENNAELAYQYYDFEKITDNVVNKVSESIIKSAGNNQYVVSYINSMLKNMKQKRVEQMKEGIKAGFELNDKSEFAANKLKDKSKPEIFVAVMTNNIPEVKTSYKKLSAGKYELISCPVDTKKECSLPIIFEKEGGKWVITDFDVKLPKR